MAPMTQSHGPRRVATSNAANCVMRRLAALLLAILLARSAHGQQANPLQGQGVPHNSTTKVFVSVYLDRLLRVDDQQYRHENVLYFYLSWTDKSASDTIYNNYMKYAEDPQSFTCNKYCTNRVDKYPLCCDDIYLPSLHLSNLVNLGEAGVVQPYKISVGQEGQVLWEVRVHGTYYQPMNYRHYPFDSFACLVDLRFEDTAMWSPDHPTGVVRLEKSSHGENMFCFGNGDDSDAWKVVEMTMGPYTHDLEYLFKEASSAFSHPADPTPLKPRPELPREKAAQRTWPANRPLNSTYDGVKDPRFAVFFVVERYPRPGVLNCVLPVVLVAFLAMFVFFLDTRFLVDRLQIIVALFLALTAVQFVLEEKIPTSSYIVPTQQLVLATYLFLLLLSLESIAVYWIVLWKERFEASKKRWEAFKRARAEKAQAAAEQRRQVEASRAQEQEPLEHEHEEGQAQGLDLYDDELKHADSGKTHDSAISIPPSPDCTEAGLPEGSSSLSPGSSTRSLLAADEPAPTGGTQQLLQPQLLQQQPQQRHQQRLLPLPVVGTTPGGGVAMLRFNKQTRLARQATRTFSGRMAQDNIYAEFVAHYVDITACVAFALLYVLSAILIFTLQHGYIDLWPSDLEI